MALKGRIPKDLADLILEKLKHYMNKYEFTAAEKRLVRDSTTLLQVPPQHHRTESVKLIIRRQLLLMKIFK